MVMRIRCRECHKKISIDEAFAGGVCRCPYCKAIVYVPASREEQRSVKRPEAPPAARPVAPWPPRPAAPAPAKGETAPIPTAKPTNPRALVALIGLALLLVMGALMVYLITQMMREKPAPSGPTAPPQQQPAPPLPKE